MSNPTKIDLSAIMKKNDVADKPIKETENHKLKTTVGNESNSKVPNIFLENIEKEDNKKKQNIKINTKENQDTENKQNKEKVIIENEGNSNKDSESEMFSNYKSDFSHKKNEIIEKIEEKNKKIRDNFNKPNTRMSLVFGLIILTLVSLSALFALDPKNHSLNNYKTSILNNASSFKTKYIDKPWVSEIIQIETNSFNIKTQKSKKGDEIYKYKKNIYLSKDGLYEVLYSEISINKEKENTKITKKETIKNALINKFK